MPHRHPALNAPAARDVLPMEASVVIAEAVDARVGPRGSLENLSQAEIDKLLDTGARAAPSRCSATARWRCSIPAATATTPRKCFERYRASTCRSCAMPGASSCRSRNAPAAAFVDGQMIRGIKEHLFAVLRDVVYTANEIVGSRPLRPARRRPRSPTRCSTSCAMRACWSTRSRPNLVVCWGGHSIDDVEYQYTKRVGYELGLRGLDVCTGCGPGAMKGPMKGATIGHAKQRISHGPLHRPHRAGHHRRRAAERHRQPAGDHAGHREAPGGLRAPGAWHRGVSGRRRHGRGNPVPAGRAARSGQRRAAAAGGADRARAHSAR